MKREAYLRPWSAAAVALLASFGAVGCLVSGFFLECSLFLVFLCCATAAAVCSLCHVYKKRWLPLLLLGTYVLLLWMQPTAGQDASLAVSWRPSDNTALNQSIEFLVKSVTTFYHRGYGFPVIQWSDGYLTENATTALCLWGVVIAMVVCRCLLKGQAHWLGILCAFAPLSLCMILTDTVPGTGYLFCLLLGLGLLLLSRTAIRQKSPVLAAYLALPLALVLGVLLLANPRAAYQGQSGALKLEQMVIDLFGDLADRWDFSWLGDSSVPGTDQLQKHANLRNAGPNTYDFSTVMELRSGRGGTVYLRGYTYDVYTGSNWSASSGKWNLGTAFLQGGKEQTRLEISTLAAHDILYTGYVPTEGQLLETRSGMLSNPEKLRSYEILCREETVITEAMLLSSHYTFSDSGAYQFLDLPTHTRALADAYLKTHLGQLREDATQLETWNYMAKLIAHVRGSAVYDLQTPRMPASELDFAMWFLEESATGYCVHFASAATVLLRAAGIPARYVTGYAVSATGDFAPTYVVDADAHAWVEAFLPSTGWIRLEPTPGFSDVTDRLPLVTEPVTEPGTTAPTETTAPHTEPTETTTPSQTRPTTPGTTETPDTPSRSSFPWKAVVIGFACVAVPVLQWRLRVYLRRKTRYRGSRNARALTCWREAQLMGRLLKREPDSALYQLALKAKFSQHTISREELRQFDQWLEQAREELRKKPLLIRLLCGPILALF